MESLVLEILPLQRRPLLARYGVTTLLVLAAFLLRYSLEGPLRGHPYLLFFPAVFAAALLFDRGSGLYATGLSAGLALFFFVEPAGSFALARSGELLALALFVAICAAIALVTEALRQALERVAAAERGKDLLLREVNHRIRNDLQGVAAALALEQRRAATPEARAGLERAAERVRVLGRVYRRLTRREGHVAVEARPFLEDLAGDLQAARLGGRAVAVEAKVEADAAVSLECAAALGLIANELVTNAAKHAFPGERAGRVELRFRREGESLALAVADDGVGAVAGGSKESGDGGGQGHRLVREFARQLEGELEVAPAGGGTCATVRFPARRALPDGRTNGRGG